MKYALAFAPLLVACHHDEAPKTNETVSAAVSNDSKSMALAPTHENAAVDHQIAAAQSAAKKNPQKVDLWITLGRAWVRKAREVEDPGYYLHADACAEVALAISPEDASALDLRALVLQSGKVKYQPEWLDAIYEVLCHKRSNIHLKVEVRFPYGCEAIGSHKAVDLYAKAWIAMTPLLDFVLDRRVVDS